MKYIVETSSVLNGSPFKMTYDDEDTERNDFLGRQSIFQYVKDLVACNYLVAQPRINIKVNSETIWTIDNGFTETWLKKEFEYIIRN